MVSGAYWASSDLIIFVLFMIHFQQFVGIKTKSFIDIQIGIRC